jgi:hypothetical protein
MNDPISGIVIIFMGAALVSVAVTLFLILVSCFVWIFTGKWIPPF